MTDVVTLLLTAVFLVAPGQMLAAVVRLPPVVAIGTAPILTFGAVAILTRLTSATGLSWGPLTFVGGVLLSAVLLWALGALFSSPRLRQLSTSEFRGRPEDSAGAPGRAATYIVLAAVTAAACIGTSATIWGMGSLRAVNQGFDALFHVNAVTLIAEMGSADPASVGAVNHFEYGSSYYPNAFHALAALVVNAGSSSVPATNALVAAVPAVLATGLAALLWQVQLYRHAAVVPLVAVSIAAFPFDLMWRGPIWPFALGVALIPSFLTLLVAAFEDRRRGVAGLVTIAAAGLLLVHPSAALGAGVFAAGFFLQRWIGQPSSLRSDLVRLAVVTFSAVLLALPAVTTAVANSGYGASYDWPAVQTAGTAVGELLLFNYDAPLPQLWLFLLLIAGLVGLRQLAQLAWWVSVTLVFTVLLVLAAAYEGPVVALLTGPWWNDRFRFAGLATIGIAVLCAHGLVVIAERAVELVRRLANNVSTAGAPPSGPASGSAASARYFDRRQWLALAVVLSLFAALTQGLYADYNRSRLQLQFALGSGGSVTPGELRAFEAMADLSDPGEVVMNDPSDGTAWMWALKGVRPMFGQAVLTPIRPPLEQDQQIVLDRFNCIDSSRAVREVIAEYEVRHVILGDGFIIPTMTRAPGLTSLSKAESLDLVYDEDGVRIYRVDLQPLVPRSADQACGGAADGSDTAGR